VKAQRGSWGLSVRPSVMKTEDADPDGEGNPAPDRSKLYRAYGAGLLKLSLYGALVPLYLLGLPALQAAGARKALYTLSYPLGQLGGVAYAMSRTTFMSERYLMAGIALLGILAALGTVRLLQAAAQKWPEARLRPALCGAAIFLVAVAPAARALKTRRLELRGYAGAGQWILAQGAHPTAMTGLEQVAYYCGSRSYYSPSTREGMSSFLRQQRMDYVTYSEKDIQKRPAYVAMLNSLDQLDPPVEYQGPAGTWKVYIQRVK